MKIKLQMQNKSGFKLKIEGEAVSILVFLSKSLRELEEADISSQLGRENALKGIIDKLQEESK